jgi:hypothetical protein
MEVRFEPDVLARLEQPARESGRPAMELAPDAEACYVDDVAGSRFAGSAPLRAIYRPATGGERDVPE